MSLEQIFGTSIQEIERILSTKTVVGEPLTVDGKTLIPLLSIGFGFGLGEGTGGNGNVAQGTGGGMGGGGGVRPIALVVIDQDGVRIEPVAMKSSAIERIANSFAERREASVEKKGHHASSRAEVHAPEGGDAQERAQ